MTNYRMLLWVLVLGVGMGGCGDDDGGANNTNNDNDNVNQGVCGDGILNTGESCDDGAANSDSMADACRTDCREPTCGDGVADTGEQCDDGGDNSDTEPDACRSTCLSPSCGDDVTDVIAGEECDDGNLTSNDLCSSGCTDESFTWRDLQVTADNQMSRIDPAIAYDANRDRVVYFGGRYALGYEQTTWEFDGQVWSQVVTATSPPGRSAHTMAWDGVRGVVVLFGGENNGPATPDYLDDTWEFDGTDWTQRTDLAVSPDPRSQHAMAYDELTGLILLQGGDDGSVLRFDDTWEFDGTAWTLVGSNALLERSDHAMAYDAGRNAVVLFGGERGNLTNTEYLNDTWEWNGAAWDVINPTVQPDPRSRHGMAYDALFGQVVLFGGVDNNANPLRGDTWLYDGTTWIQVAPTSPNARFAVSMAFDSLRGRVVLFGGSDGNFLNDTWISVAE